MPGAMKTTNMAAPIAVFEENSDPDVEEWPSEFIDYRSPTTMDDMLNSNGENFPVLSSKEEISPDNFCEMKTSSSIEDLVNNFEEKLAVCFRNYDYDTERFAPVQVLTKEELMRNSKCVYFHFSGTFSPWLKMYLWEGDVLDVNRATLRQGWGRT